jgi:hypothetical protein
MAPIEPQKKWPNALKILYFVFHKDDIKATSPKRLISNPQTQSKAPKLND